MTPLPAAAAIVALEQGPHAPTQWWCDPALPDTIAAWEQPRRVLVHPAICHAVAVAIHAYRNQQQPVDGALVADAVMVVLHEQAHVDGIERECRAEATAVRESPPVLRLILGRRARALTAALAEAAYIIRSDPKTYQPC